MRYVIAVPPGRLISSNHMVYAVGSDFTFSYWYRCVSMTVCVCVIYMAYAFAVACLSTRSLFRDRPPAAWPDACDMHRTPLSWPGVVPQCYRSAAGYAVYAQRRQRSRQRPTHAANCHLVGQECDAHVDDDERGVHDDGNDGAGGADSVACLCED